MTNTQSTQLYMRDFAYTDSRSIHAHIKGTSLRANTYRAVEAVCGFLGRADARDSTFKKVGFEMLLAISDITFCAAVSLIVFG